MLPLLGASVILLLASHALPPRHADAPLRPRARALPRGASREIPIHQRCAFFLRHEWLGFHPLRGVCSALFLAIAIPWRRGVAPLLRPVFWLQVRDEYWPWLPLPWPGAPLFRRLFVLCFRRLRVLFPPPKFASPLLHGLFSLFPCALWHRLRLVRAARFLVWLCAPLRRARVLRLVKHLHGLRLPDAPWIRPQVAYVHVPPRLWRALRFPRSLGEVSPLFWLLYLLRGGFVLLLRAEILLAP